MRYRFMDVLLLVYKTNWRNLNSLLYWKNEVLHYSNMRPGYVKVIAVGTHLDLRPKGKGVLSKEVSAWCTQHQIDHHIEVSCKTGENIDALIKLIAGCQKKAMTGYRLLPSQDAWHRMVPPLHASKPPSSSKQRRRVKNQHLKAELPKKPTPKIRCGCWELTGICIVCLFLAWMVHCLVNYQPAAITSSIRLK